MSERESECDWWVRTHSHNHSNNTSNSLHGGGFWVRSSLKLVAVGSPASKTERKSLTRRGLESMPFPKEHTQKKKKKKKNNSIERNLETSKTTE